MNDSVNILYDHYKDSFENIKQNEKQRNSFFVWIAILTSLLFFIWVNPLEAQEVINSVIQSKINQDVIFNFNTVQSLIWTILLYLTIRYFQQTINIEKQYIYLHNLEKTIATIIKHDFCREGIHYANNYSLFSNTTYYFYTIVFPMLYIIILVLNIVSNFSVLNLIFCVSIILFVILYLFCKNIKIK